VNIYTDGDDGSDRSVATQALQALGPGTHTFTLFGARSAGAGKVQLFDPALSAIFMPQGGQAASSASAPQLSGWTTAAPDLQPVISCTLTLPISGTVYISASASAGVAAGSGAYEGQFQLGVDSFALARTQRRVNIYADSGDGADKSVATQALQALGPGTHTFTLFGARSAGAGTVQLHEPALAVVALNDLPKIGGSLYLPVVAR
jgi:hypothetical protein